MSEINEFALKAVFVKLRAKTTICGKVGVQIIHSGGYCTCTCREVMG